MARLGALANIRQNQLEMRWLMTFAAAVAATAATAAFVARRSGERTTTQRRDFEEHVAGGIDGRMGGGGYRGEDQESPLLLLGLQMLGGRGSDAAGGGRAGEQTACDGIEDHFLCSRRGRDEAAGQNRGGVSSVLFVLCFVRSKDESERHRWHHFEAHVLLVVGMVVYGRGVCCVGYGI